MRKKQDGNGANDCHIGAITSFFESPMVVRADNVLSVSGMVLEIAPMPLSEGNGIGIVEMHWLDNNGLPRFANDCSSEP